MGPERVVLGAIDTPVGRYGAVLSGRGLCRLTSPAEPLTLGQDWVARWMPHAVCVSDQSVLDPVAEQLLAYFAGERRGFSLDLDLRGTPFQLQVWAALQAIPFGQVRTYTEIAHLLGRPRAVRAVGAANGANPVALVVPCHRVIGSNGRLVGYAGGLGLKHRLLAHEGVVLERTDSE